MNRLYDVVDTMHKEANAANMLSRAGNFLMNNKSTAAGGALGGIYGAYKGSQGENGGLKGALLGAAQGAAGGALIGNVGARVANSGAIKGYKAARERVMDEAGVAAQNRGFLSRHLGQGRRDIKAVRESNKQAKQIRNIRADVSNIAEREASGLMAADKARSLRDSKMSQNAFTNLQAARDKLIFGGIGAGMALSTGAGLISAGAKAGQGVTNEQRMQNLRAKYQRTGQLDPREQRMLTNMMAGRPQGSSSAV
ncbi:MAG: hypothetical protein VXZ72_02135 [Chlamydiota bacterium]|nr:hypothetical protein [Chlamydiota bacterium]